LFDGIPLIGRAINQSQKIKRIKRTIVSTDCQEIAKIAKQYGAEVPFIRPSELATDFAPEWLSWQHAIKFLQTQEPGFILSPVISLPTTAPLRHVSDIEKCLDFYQNNQLDAVITVSPARRSPYFNMVRNGKDGYAEIVIKPPADIYRRQDAPEIYDIATVAYIADAAYILRSKSLLEGRVGMVNIPIERTSDIDTLLDFDIAEFLWRKSKNENT
jgi:N-acylneuraminate cytidylyltransferase